ncbi:MAG: HK97 gp10 family phage protein [Rhodospirillaceae bacterium]|nr:MAG: HK97 gp10 family phage protein [Rhodospirillaceae bacterium]
MTDDVKITWETGRLTKLMEQAPDIVVEELAAAVTEGSMLLEREAKERTPTSGAGTLRDSIGALPVEIGGGRVTGGIATSLAYALPIELGSKPHWAPIEPLIDWVHRKLGKVDAEARSVARMVQLKIAKKGTKGHFMFRDAGEAVTPQFYRMLEAALDRAQVRIEGAR